MKPFLFGDTCNVILVVETKCYLFRHEIEIFCLRCVRKVKISDSTMYIAPHGSDIVKELMIKR